MTPIVNAGFSLLFVVVTATAPMAAEVSLTAASFQDEDVVFAKHFFRWVRETNERCDNEIQISVLGPDTIRPILQWKALKEGQVDMYFGPANYYRGVIPEVDVFHLAHNDPTKQRQTGAWAILNDLHKERMNAWYLTTLLAGIKFFIFTTKPTPDGRFDDFNLRSVPLYGHFMRSLGAHTQYLVAEEVGDALRRHEIDGFGWPLWGVDHFGWEEFVNYRYGPGFLDAAAPVLVNLDTWKALSKEQRGCLNKMAAWVEREWPQWRSAEDRLQIAALDRAGIEYVDLGPEFPRQVEGIVWSVLGATLPDFVQKMKPLLGVPD